jgi:hypothetical protein
VRVTKSRAKVGERLPYLLGKLKAPRVLQRLEQTAERARAEQWPYEQFLETLLEAEVDVAGPTAPRSIKARTKTSGSRIRPWLNEA